MCLSKKDQPPAVFFFHLPSRWSSLLAERKPVFYQEELPVELGEVSQFIHQEN
jgi:hypothetical protein